MGLIDGAGGNGGILGGLGQMLDPLGIFGGGKGGEAGGGDMLNKILDPLGFIPAIKGEIDKAMKHEVDPSIQQNTDKYMDYVNGINQGPPTEMPPPTEDTKPDAGYASDHTAENTDHSGEATQNSNSTEGSDSNIQCNQYGQQGTQNTQSAQNDQQPKPEYTWNAEEAQKLGIPLAQMVDNGSRMVLDYQYVKQSPEAADAAQKEWKRRQADEAVRHAQALITNWDWIQKNFEGDNGGWADMKNNIEVVLAKWQAGQLPNTPDVAAAVAACKWLKEHPDQFAQIVGESGCGAGMISSEGIQKYQAKMMEVAKQNQPPTTNPTPTNNTGGGFAINQSGQGVVVNVFQQNPTPTNPQPTTPVTGSVGGSGSAGGAGSVGAAAAQGGSLEAAIGKMDKGIADMQTQIENMTTQMLEAMNSSDPKDKAKAEGLKSQLSMLNLKLQSVMEMRKEMFQLLSNLWKSYHDMSIHAIGNIR